ncbi:Hypothetical predicted protein [Paramuricea clavata]|uniref:Uncharacterized protein n=1 Tax=Paramuricea clavata TaxID=317549 RepID=A0A7D9HQZ9_PARCT|nr:Hypothetical predicted protein [Paramuricea clavata]
MIDILQTIHNKYLPVSTRTKSYSLTEQDSGQNLAINQLKQQKLSETQPDIGFVSLPVMNETFVSPVYGCKFGLNEHNIARQIVLLKRDNCHAAFTAKHGR